MQYFKAGWDAAWVVIAKLWEIFLLLLGFFLPAIMVLVATSLLVVIGAIIYWAYTDGRKKRKEVERERRARATKADDRWGTKEPPTR